MITPYLLSKTYQDMIRTIIAGISCTVLRYFAFTFTTTSHSYKSYNSFICEKYFYMWART